MIDYLYLSHSKGYAARQQALIIKSLLEALGLQGKEVFYDDAKGNYFTFEKGVDLSRRVIVKFLIVDSPILEPRISSIVFDRLIWRVRGVLPEEMVLRHRIFGPLLKKHYYENEMNFLKKAESIWFVSQEMKNHYCLMAEKRGSSCFDKSIFVPNTFLKSEARKKENSNVGVCYSGGLSAWQEPKKIIGVLNNLQSQNMTTAILTPKSAVNEPLLRKSLSKVFSSSQDDLIDALQQYSAGLLIRKNSIVNRVSCPFKIADYLKAGLKVIMTANIGFWPSVANQYPNVFLPIDYKGILTDFNGTISDIMAFCRKPATESDFDAVFKETSLENYIPYVRKQLY